jgi:hypothetical protein
MERYTLEDHEAYRKEQDEKAAKEEEARNERMEKESAPPGVAGRWRQGGGLREGVAETPRRGAAPAEERRAMRQRLVDPTRARAPGNAKIR